MNHLTPTAAWALLQQRRHEPPENAPLFVDVRMEIESLYVGRPPGVVNVPWYEYPDLQPDPARFVRLVTEEAGTPHRTVLIICRSGKRSAEAGHVLEAAGFTDVVNILCGFEGELDDRFHRSTVNGWRHDGLPWEQM
jgi:rhodanese-related sulfurtransferase